MDQRLLSSDQSIYAIERPHPKLWSYYLLQALAFPPAFPFVILPLYFRYHTLRYRFTQEGISMRWGILFRREIIIQYARIQDIHLRSNLVERWLRLSKVLIQTASGSADAEMTLEGLLEFEAVRDFLYARMRGVSDTDYTSRADEKPEGESTPAQHGDPLATTLAEVAQELKAIRVALEKRSSPGTRDSHHD